MKTPVNVLDLFNDRCTEKMSIDELASKLRAMVKARVDNGLEIFPIPRIAQE